MSANTGENMKPDAFKRVSRSVKPPAVPPKSQSLRVYQTPGDPETLRSPSVSPKPFPRSLTSARLSPTLQSRSPHQSTSLDSPNIGYGSVAIEHPVSPRPVCPPPVPPKNYIYQHPKVLTSSDTSYGRQTPSPVSLSSTESERRPSSPHHSPSEPRSSPGPHRTQSEGSVAVARTLTSQTLQLPPKVPKARHIYLTTDDLSGDDLSAGDLSADDLSVDDTEGRQSHLTTDQRAEYDTPSNKETIPCHPTPPPVSPKMKTQDRPQPTWNTIESYDNRPYHPKPPPRPSMLSGRHAPQSDNHYQAPVGTTENKTTENRDQSEGYQIPRPGGPAPEACRDRGVNLSPSSISRDGYKYMPGRPSSPASLKQKPEQRPGYELSMPSAIYEPTPTVELLEPGTMEQEPSTASGGKVSSYSVRPRPPSFSPPPPPSSSGSSRLHPTGGNSEHSKIPPYVQVLPRCSGFQFRTQGTVRKSHIPPGTFPRYLLEPLLVNDPTLPRSQVKEEEEELGRLSKLWRKELLFPAPSSSHRMSAEEETTWRFNQTAKKVYMTLKCFESMLLKREDTLRSHISELKSISDNLDKIKESHRLKGFKGGAAGTVGGVVAVVGIALAPLTMGASLAVTAVGAGMAVAAGGIGAGAAKKNKKVKNEDQKRAEDIMKAYRNQVVDLEESLTVVRTGMEELRRHDVTRLTGACEDSVWMARVACAAYCYGEVGGAKPTLLSVDNIMKGFDVVPEECRSDSSGQEMKKACKKKFAAKVRTAAQQLQEGLDDMNHALEIFSMVSASI